MKQPALLAASLLALTELVIAGQNVVIESIYSAPPGWTRDMKAHPEQAIRLRIALEQPNVSNGRFEQTLYDISTPGHPSHGQHLTQLELRDLVKPRQESTDAVIDWLRSAGVPEPDIEDAGDWVNFRTTVGKASKLLNADFGVFTYEGTKERKVRTLKYSVPEEIKPHITMIQPTTVFGHMQRHSSQVFKIEESPYSIHATAAINSSCSTLVTPDCLRDLYKIGNYTANPDVETILGVSGFLEQYAKYDALDTFLQRFAPYAKNQTFTAPLINGGLNNQSDTVHSDVEANLDMQYAAGLGFDTDIRFYSTGGRGPLIPDLDQPDPSHNSDEPYLELVTYLLGLPASALPTTLTTSYGDNEREIPLPYAQKVCTMLGQLGARGVSVLFSSGDSGPGSACQTNDGRNTTRFTPTFPGACPYITSVGGTAGNSPERAVSFSSGGFSDYFPRPSYQDAAVEAWRSGAVGAAETSQFDGLFNAAGRGFPDVAASGSGYQVVTQGRVISVGGTSASSPTFAAIVSLVNNALVAQGKAPLGFLNPWLYSAVATGGGLTDVAAGRSSGCLDHSLYSGRPTPPVPGAGWNATEGWDPVTGLGTPLFDKLLDLALQGAAPARR